MPTDLFKLSNTSKIIIIVIFKLFIVDEDKYFSFPSFANEILAYAYGHWKVLYFFQVVIRSRIDVNFFFCRTFM